jgi:hypothetical protein
VAGARPADAATKARAESAGAWAAAVARIAFSYRRSATGGPSAEHPRVPAQPRASRTDNDLDGPADREDLAVFFKCVREHA